MIVGSNKCPWKFRVMKTVCYTRQLGFPRLRFGQWGWEVSIRDFLGDKSFSIDFLITNRLEPVNENIRLMHHLQAPIQ